MKIGRFRDKSGTHRTLFEQTTPERILDCAVALRRSKLAGDDIKFAVFEDRAQNRCPGTRNEEVGPATGRFSQTTSDGKSDSASAFVASRRSIFIYNTFADELSN